MLAVALLCLPLLAGCAGNDDSSDAAESSLLPMTLAEWLFPPDASHATGDPVGVAHLSITPMKAGDNDLTVSLTDLDGAPLDAGDLTLAWRPLAPDATETQADVAPVEDEPATWQVENLKLDDGWYAFEVALSRNGDTVGASSLYAMLPDPSVYGGDAVDTPDTDPDAEALYERALATYGDWRTGRWRENLGSGEDVLVVTRYAVDSSDPDRARMETQSVYAGAFRPQKDGTRSPVQRNFGHRIAIGRQWWSFDDGQWSESSGLPVASFAERADVYSGATGIRPAGTETIDGVETRLITFYLPPKGGQAEAWFTWWIDPESGNLVRMAMVAQMHFMIWDFYDINAPVEIVPPGAESATPGASPAATPAAQGLPSVAAR
jgi:hypothetical protein